MGCVILIILGVGFLVFIYLWSSREEKRFEEKYGGNNNEGLEDSPYKGV